MACVGVSGAATSRHLKNSIARGFRPCSTSNCCTAAATRARCRSRCSRRAAPPPARVGACVPPDPRVRRRSGRRASCRTHWRWCSAWVRRDARAATASTRRTGAARESRQPTPAAPRVIRPGRHAVLAGGAGASTGDRAATPGGDPPRAQGGPAEGGPASVCRAELVHGDRPRLPSRHVCVPGDRPPAASGSSAQAVARAPRPSARRVQRGTRRVVVDPAGHRDQAEQMSNGLSSPRRCIEKRGRPSVMPNEPSAATRPVM